MKRKIIIVTIIILALAGGYCAWKQKSAKSKQESFKPVAVEKGAISISVMATGVVQPQNRLELKPAIAGRVEDMLVQEGQAVKRGQLLAWLSSSERAALLDAARAQGAAELKKWELIYKPAPMVAPMDGIIIARNAEPGQTVALSDIPLVMSDRLIVKAQVDETDIGRLEAGQVTEITLDAYSSKKIPGKVRTIAYEAKTVNNVTIYEVDVLPDEVPPFMRSGMTANVSFLVNRKEGILVLPQAAVRQGEGGSFVFIANGNSTKKKEKRQIKTGITDGKMIEITDGLAEGDKVLVADVKWDKGGGSQASSPLSPMGGGRRR
ncbi:MAG: hypothetical protein A2901_06860 [Elusimicrobia bacterium RIFCSPLOWO2_01_FULL_54_10]|nr:MAG: hypothetical protein A2901_06860 [Elusimicrobia bacterium RIFCSPLOWO2_01_FULL_54_10]